MAQQKKWIKIETLTPLHIGSGKVFQGNFEYLYFQPENKVSVIDDQKIFGIIGSENLDKWLSIIDRREDLLAYLRQRRPSVVAAETAMRTMRVDGKKPAGENTIREQLHTGMMQPTLPGSSLKGAIRTAFFSKLLRAKPHLVKQISAERQGNKNAFNDTDLSKELFGKSPAYDVFRLLRVGDVCFDETICVLAETLNQTAPGEFQIKDSIKQFVECVAAGSTGVGRLQIPELHRKPANNLQAGVKTRLDEHFKGHNLEQIDFEKILATVNQHTQKLLAKELALWQSKDMPERAEEMIESLTELLEASRNCSPHECIVRIGFGSGYKSMTGDWQEELMEKRELRKLARNVQRKDYPENILFPKTRKVLLNGKIMGFVKLSLISDTELAGIEKEKETRRNQELQKQLILQEKLRLDAEKAEQEKQQQEAEAQRKAEEQKQKKQEEIAQKFREGKLSSGDKLDAIVVKKEGNNVICKLLADPGQKLYPVRYPAGFPVDTIIEVTVSVMKQGNKKVIQSISNPVEKK